MNKNIICIVVCVLAILLMTVLDSRGQIGITGNAAFVGAAGFSAASTGGGGGSPAFVKQVGQWAVLNGSSAATLTVTLTNGASAGNYVVMGGYVANTNWVASLSDSRGNTWTVLTNSVDTYNGAWLACAPVSTALQSGDTITFAVTQTGYLTHAGAILELSGVSAVDKRTQVSQYTASPGLTITPDNVPSIIVAVINSDAQPNYSGGNYTSAATVTNGTKYSFFAYTNAASVAALPVGGYITASTLFEIAASFK